MAKKKKNVAATVTKTFLKLDSGSTYEVFAADGKFYDCGKSKFRKSNPHIISVWNVEDNEQEEDSDGDNDYRRNL